MRRRLIPFAGILLALPLTALPAQAELTIHVDKGAQRMTVSRDGRFLYDWAVSTGRAGLNTPSGTFKPFRMDIDHVSEKYDNSPMPHSIFFTKTGDAIHGTYEQKWLGNAVSHGCVRLSRRHAAILWDLVKQEKMANTKVVLTGHIRPNAPLVAHNARARDETASAASDYGRPWTDGAAYDQANSAYQDGGGYYDNNAPPPPPPDDIPPPRDERYGTRHDSPAPFPFFLFGQ